MDGLNKHFAGKPPTTAMDDLTLEVEDGEFVVLLGPSGCGKTTTLRCLAGLETPDEGRIRFGDTDVFDSSRKINLTPDKRSIGMVFQSYALWPHMTVRKNIAYPIKARKLTKVADNWAEETADLVDCRHLLDRYPAQLSGGQQQRVALARGLVARPDVVLFDEPLSNLDARLRDSVRAQLHELHNRLRFSAVFVTHDQSEALALADRVVIMRAGRFEQVGTPEEIFESPATEYVADFIGMSNGLPLRRAADDWVVSDERVSGHLDVPRDQDEVHVRLRPDDVHLAPAGSTIDPIMVTARANVVDSQFGGRHIDVVVRLGDHRLEARVPSRSYDGWGKSLRLDDELLFAFDPRTALLYQADGQRIMPGPTGVRVTAGV
jgi:iron(III) transport system ATP-binding protein